MRKWPTLQPPPWQVLKAKDVLAKNVGAVKLVMRDDRTGDDNGVFDYTYPLDEHFEPGILDITNFDVREDKSKYYFTLKFANLVQPGWHPEYGFQLTFAAICLHTPEGKRVAVGANSGYVFPDTRKCSRIIYVGGGLRVEDDGNQTVASFTPMALADAFGDTSTKSISFALPKTLFPKLKGGGLWTVLVGAQDDHGGVGMGEFREVKATAEQWAGGGDLEDRGNVYDVLLTDSGVLMEVRH
jgi:carbohydrate-binding DOMON domain-containing protein